MNKAISHPTLHEVMPGRVLVHRLEGVHTQDRFISSCYLNVVPSKSGEEVSVVNSLRHALAVERHQVDRLDVSHDVRRALLCDLELVQEVLPTIVGNRDTRGIAAFVDSEAGEGWLMRLPWPVRNRTFFEHHFVVWPLQLLLDQSDRFAIVLADRDDARLFDFFLERLEEAETIVDPVPGRIRIPTPSYELTYLHRRDQHMHRHFDMTSQVALRRFEREPFEHLIIGGLREILPTFESYLHRYLRDRVLTRWDIDVHAPLAKIRERACQTEREYLDQAAQSTWQKILDQPGAQGPEAVFAALWQRRVQTLLVARGARRSGFCCSVCGRLQLSGTQCVECSSAVEGRTDIFEVAVCEAIEQRSHVCYWDDPALAKAGSLGALNRF